MCDLFQVTEELRKKAFRLVDTPLIIVRSLYPNYRQQPEKLIGKLGETWKFRNIIYHPGPGNTNCLSFVWHCYRRLGDVDLWLVAWRNELRAAIVGIEWFILVMSW
jgi:hypothetical protein